jgi:hypothetical protein
MTERVAVYIDFDNVVISRYDHVHGKGAWRKDDARAHDMTTGGNDPVSARLAAAKVDLGAIIDYATSFGIVAMTRAYADWSVPANAAYRHDHATSPDHASRSHRRGDSDYIPLAQLSKRLGRYVVGIGVKSQMQRLNPALGDGPIVQLSPVWQTASMLLPSVSRTNAP